MYIVHSLWNKISIFMFYLKSKDISDFRRYLINHQFGIYEGNKLVGKLLYEFSKDNTFLVMIDWKIGELFQL